MIGMITSLTSDVTMAPKAAPMITATARSTTLPFMAKSRNSFSMGKVPSSLAKKGQINNLVDQAGMDHGAAHSRTRSLRHRHHRQAQLLVHLAEQRHRIFDRRRAGLHEQV